MISVSADPPLLAFSVDAASSAYRLMANAPTLVVNFLSAEQVELSARFATSGIDRFATTDWWPLPTGEPVLTGSAAWIRGEIVQRTPVGRSVLVSVLALESEVAEAGAPVLARGRVAADAPAGGFYVAPVLFGPVDPASPIAQEEVFGPVLCAMPFDTEAEAIAIANGTQYGLVASVWTRDGARQARVANAMRCGQVFINGFGAGGGVELPFGGIRKSGHGREKGFEALYEFSTIRTIVNHHG